MLSNTFDERIRRKIFLYLYTLLAGDFDDGGNERDDGIKEKKGDCKKKNRS